MSKKILGLDLGTNSIGWALIDKENEKILGMGSRILPMSQDILGKFDSGQTISQTAKRTGFRGVRRLLERDLLRRERLHRMLNVLNFLPEHYAVDIDFEHRLGQFKKGKEPKLAYRKNADEKQEFIFQDSFREMVEEFRVSQPGLFYAKPNGTETKIPYDWTIYFLRKKALTQRISKEELVWVLLHFNQKRGYYQLRGEDENEAEDGKEKKYEVLKVEKLVDSGEKIKATGAILYDVYFTNGLKYDSQITKTEDWIDKIKEFIVTKTIAKNGETKISFKKVNSEEDWIAIKKKSEQDIQSSNQTVGEYIYNTLLQQPNQKIRGKLIRTIERKFYKEELRRILEKQIEFHPDLQDRKLYNDCVEELYAFNEAHKASIVNRGFDYLFLDDILFYQRPLKSKKSLISDCSLEFRNYRTENGEIRKQALKAIAKSNPLFQEFRLLQFLNNLRVFKAEAGKEVDITAELLPDSESWEILYGWMNGLTEIDQNTFLRYKPFDIEGRIKEALGTEAFKIFKKDKEQGLHTFYRWNYVQDKTYPLNETRGEILKRLKKLNITDSFLTKELEAKLWHILYSVEDKTEIKSALTKYAKENNLPEAFVEMFVKYPRIKKDYGSYSEKAIKKLLPLMRFGSGWSFDAIDANTKDRISKIINGEYDEKIKDRVRDKTIHLKNENDFKGLPLWLTSYIVYDRHSEAGEIKFWKTSDKIDLLKQHSLRNPIVEQVINETLQTIKEIWNYYGNGAQDFFSEIHVELGREMKNPADKRKKMTERISENENTNTRIKLLLQELFIDDEIENVRPYSPMQQEILKLYEEGAYDNETNIAALDEINKIPKKNQPTSADLNRYKLWMEQKYYSPYTGKPIPLSKLFTSEYQIEHIIPQSRFFDDSMSNKIICEAEINSLKDNNLAHEFIKKYGGTKFEVSKGKFADILSLANYEVHVKNYFSKNKSKLNKLMLDEIPDSFIERQMNDSRYISKTVAALLSNIVREENEQEAVAKRIVMSNGSITSALKQDWGLNDVWNGLITPRFERLNRMKNSDEFGAWVNKDGKKVFQINTLHSDLQKLNKKRIDHRHHALDALVVACSTRNHINYLNNDNANGKDKNKPLRYDLRNRLRAIEEVEVEKWEDGRKVKKKIKVAKKFLKPWDTFTQDAKEQLGKVIVSFKKNTRVINKTSNYYQKWEKQDDGTHKKIFVKQEKGDSWAIRKPMHEETVSGLVDLPWVKLGKKEKTTATRKILDKSFNLEKIKKITDRGIQKILINYLQEKGDPELAFSSEGLEELNSKISLYTNNLPHKSIYKVRTYEKGVGRFCLGNEGNKNTKFVQGSPNLFFAIYADEDGNRSYSTVPLNEVIENQKLGALSREKPQDCSVPKQNEKGHKLLFFLNPYDLVYVPSEEERENMSLVDFNNLDKKRVERIFAVNDFSSAIYFSPASLAKAIAPKEVDMSYDEEKKKITGSFDTKTASLDGVQIKEICWKLETDRLGNIKKIITGRKSYQGERPLNILQEPVVDYGSEGDHAFSVSNESDAKRMASLSPQEHLGNIAELHNSVFREKLKEAMDKKIKFRN